MKILTTTRLSNYDGHFLNFIPIQLDYNWEVIRLLLKNYFSEIIKKKDSEFISLFREITIKDPDTDEIYQLDISDNSFLDDDQFVEQVVNKEDIFNSFLKKLKTSKFFQRVLLQNNDGSILIFPTINDNYSNDNVVYVESLIKWIKERDKEVDLLLLLHDKDVYNTINPIKNHKVGKDDPSLSKDIEESSELFTLIQEGKVFVFIHNSDEDFYCRHIVNNEQVESISTSDIVEILESVPKNCSFSTKLGQQMRHEDMLNIIRENGSNNCYDFSHTFLE